MAGPKSTFNRFIERNNDYLDIGTEFLEGYLIYNSTVKYNNTAAEKYWNKIDPKNTRILALTTRLYKLYNNKNFFPRKIPRGSR